MFASIKAIPEAIKSWAENREQLYNAIACAASVLVAVAVLTGTPPTHSLAILARGFGLSAFADWLTVDAPPIIAAHSAMVHEAALFAVGLLLAGMLIVPLVRGRQDDSQWFAYEFLRLIGAPAPATIWVLLAVAAQHGDVGPALHEWARAGACVAVWTVAGLLVIGVLTLMARRIGIEELLRPLLRFPAALLFRVVYGAGVIALGVILAAVSLPVKFIAWFVRLESDQRRRFRMEMEHQRAADAPQPTGAVERKVQ